jgi:N-acetylmuramoyl-L-alanine amidase
MKARDIRFIVVHCTATPQTATVEAIQRYWRVNLKWKSNGYHVIVKPNGEAIRLSPDEAICNGVAGHNANSLHVSYIGGVDAKGKAIDNRTPEQKETMLNILRDWKRKYPTATIQGHRDFPNVKKDCPSFNAKTEYALIR